MPETDKEVGAILESIRNVTPEVVEQAVAYWRILDTVWLGIMGSIVLIALVVCFRSWRVARRDGWTEYTCIISSFVACIALLICAPIACDLAKTYIAPDYYAADCMVELGRKALNK